MKVAIIGCGTIANNAHMPSYSRNPKAEMVWFCDLIIEKAEAAKAKYGNENSRVTTDYREVLADPEVQAVSVCTPNNVHAEIAIAAMKAGKDVLCEKPAGRTYAEVEQMQKVQHETGKVLKRARDP